MPSRRLQRPNGAYICLGSNDARAAAMLKAARLRLGVIPDVRPGSASGIYRTEPQDCKEQAWFLNQVVEVFPGNSWTPESFLLTLLDMERDLGRTRASGDKRYGPRVIDMDLLLYGAAKSSSPSCLLPHPRMSRRAFVLVPLLEIAPDIHIDDVSVKSLLDRLKYRVEDNRIFQ
ncbi:MAG: 2-amino-4-hydroxy-6-hydroxymethyldihydropteridine diphosphokinase [Desulfovibrio sp.]|nr:2-amino-4-hydroxy-6-hydroxymethyldihydropteridine diphosphokinase [Desulfovibrio sp.]